MKTEVSVFVSCNLSNRSHFFAHVAMMLLFCIAFVVNFTRPCLHVWKNVSRECYGKSKKTRST